MSKCKFKRVLTTFLKYLTLVIWTLIVFLPIITIIFGAFKTYEEFIGTNGITPPQSFLNFENFKVAFEKGKMAMGFINTFILIILGVVGSVIIGSMVAYGINRFEFRFKKLVLFLYLLVSIVPMEIAQVSTFRVINYMGMYNTRVAPIVLYIGADVIMVYIYLQILEKIPRELDKAAMLEGANYFTIYRKIIFPLLKPATATVAMLKIVSIYNDFYIPFLYMPGENLQTISTSLFKFIGPAGAQWQLICAAILISLVPMIIFFIILQKQIYSGITAGSIR